MNKVYSVIILFLLCACNRKSNTSVSASNSDSIEINVLKKAASEIQYKDIDSAKKLYTQIGVIARNAPSSKELMEYYKIMSAFYGIRLKDLTNSKKYLDSAWTLAQRKENKDLTYKAYFIEGRYYLACDNILEATNSFVKSIESQGKPADSLILFITYSDLSKIYFLQRDFEKAVAYYRPLMAYDEHMRDTASMIRNYLNFYSYVDHSKNPDSAIDYLYKAKYLTDITNHKFLHHILLFNFSLYYSRKGNFDSALKYIDEAVAEQESKKVSPENFFKFYILKCQIHTDKKDYRQANLALTNAVKHIELDKIDINDQSNYYNTLHSLRKNERNYSDALAALEKQIEVQDKINKNIKDEQLLNHEKELKRLSVDNIINDQNHQITRQRLYTVILTVTCLLLCIIAVFFYLHFKKIKNIETLKWMQKEKEIELENEKMMVRNQIEERNRISQEMHDDLGSTLTTISMAVELFNLHPNNNLPIQIINQSTNELNNKINEIVWSLNVHNDTLLSLIAYFRKFARNFLNDAGIKLTWEQKDTIDEKTLQGYIRRSIYLSLKEILNNIVKHAQANEVNITIEYTDPNLNIIIKDNGVGLVEESNYQLSNVGNGLKNIKKGILKLNGTVEYLNNNGTIVVLNIPI